jgi:hypothetical protein
MNTSFGLLNSNDFGIIQLFMLMYFSLFKNDLVTNKLNLGISWILFCVSVVLSIFPQIFSISMLFFRNMGRNYAVANRFYFLGLFSFLVNCLSIIFLYFAFRKKRSH